MANEKKLTYSFFIGEKPIEKITPEQAEKMAQRIGETMSNYYTTRPQEYQKIKSRSEGQ